MLYIIIIIFGNSLYGSYQSSKTWKPCVHSSEKTPKDSLDIVWNFMLSCWECWDNINILDFVVKEYDDSISSEI